MQRGGIGAAAGEEQQEGGEGRGGTDMSPPSVGEDMTLGGLPAGWRCNIGLQATSQA